MTDNKKRSYNQGNRNAAKENPLQGGLSLRIDIKLKAALTALAATQQRSLNAMINDALSAYLDAQTANTQLKIEMPAQPSPKQAQTLAAKYHATANEIAAFETDRHAFFRALDDAIYGDDLLIKRQTYKGHSLITFTDDSAIATSWDDGSVRVLDNQQELDDR